MISLVQRIINLFYSINPRLYDRITDNFEVRGARHQLLEDLGIQCGERVIEIGVGTGKNLIYYPNEAYYIAIDINRRMLVRAVQKSLVYPMLNSTSWTQAT